MVKLLPAVQYCGRGCMQLQLRVMERQCRKMDMRATRGHQRHEHSYTMCISHMTPVNSKLFNFKTFNLELFPCCVARGGTPLNKAAQPLSLHNNTTNNTTTHTHTTQQKSAALSALGGECSCTAACGFKMLLPHGHIDEVCSAVPWLL